MKIHIPYILLLMLGISMFCITRSDAQVHINESSNVRSLMDSYKNVNMQQDEVKGWRIQIITTDDRRKMEAARAKFNNLYPGIKTSWVHESPYYKLKVGAYKNKIDLQGLIYELKQKFRGIIPVIERIPKKDLIL